jgi:5-methyltetrahydropteroyltriglutamate--homocysteine methyltransferase
VDVGLLTTTVGWFPKPVDLRRARWRFSEEEIEAAELHAAEAEATGRALRLQEDVGLDVLVDGQMDRADSVSYFAEHLDGMEVAGFVRCFGNRYFRKPRIVGEVGRTGPITVEHWSAAQKMVGKPVRAVLTGPYTLMDWSFDEHYGSREACCLALADVVRDEARDLLAAGATEVQIDEPATSSRPEEMALVCEALGRVTGPLEGKVRTWTHIAYGDMQPVLDDVFALPVDGLLLEMVNSGFPLLDRLGGLPEGMLLGAGVVDVHSTEVESADVVRERTERLLEVVPAERLWLMPDAGLRTLPAAVAEAKLRAIVDAAGR